MSNTRSRRSQWLRLAVLATAIAAVLLVASGASLWHHDAPGSAATCPICHLAHLPALNAAPGATLSTPTVVDWVAPAPRRRAHATIVARDFSPRAPPA